MIDNKSKTNNHDEEIKKQVLLLQNPEEQEGFNIINKMSPNNKNMNILAEAESISRREDLYANLKTKYKNTNYYTIKDIVEECVKFDLAFFSSSKFEGHLSIEFGKKIGKFCKENNLVVSEDVYRNHIYFLTPRPIGGGRISHSKFRVDSKDSHDENHNIKNPLAFFMVQERGEEFYILIDGNKSYKGIFNRLKGYTFWDENNYRSMAGCVFFFALAVLFPTIFFTEYVFYILPYIIIGVLAIAFGFAFTGATLFTFEDSDEAKYAVSKNYYERYDVKKKPMIETLFLWTLLIAMTWASVNIITNIKLRVNGNLYDNNTTEDRVYEKEMTAANRVYAIGKSNYKKTITQTVYSPGILFPNKDVKVLSTEWYAKD